MKIETLHAAVAVGHDRHGILLGDSLAHVKERVVEHVVRQLEHKELRGEEKIRQLQRQVDDLRAQHAALGARVSEFEMFINKLRTSLPFRLHRHVRHWLGRGGQNNGPHARVLFAADHQGDALLPAKPP